MMLSTQRAAVPSNSPLLLERKAGRGGVGRQRLLVRGSMAPIGRKKTRSGPSSQSVPTRSSPPPSTRPPAAPTPSFQPSNPTELFFLGRALLDTINDRITSAFLDVLTEASKTGAELPSLVAEFQEEVMARAQAERSRSGESGVASAYSRSSSVGSVALAPSSTTPQPAVDLQEVVDDLRAEVAAARAVAQAVKSKTADKATPLNGASMY